MKTMVRDELCGHLIGAFSGGERRHWRPGNSGSGRGCRTTMCLTLRREWRKQCQKRELEVVTETLWDGVLYAFPLSCGEILSGKDVDFSR